VSVSMWWVVDGGQVFGGLEGYDNMRQTGHRSGLG
jgi:hypothetical protein